MILFYQHVRAPMDRNGNSRSCYMVYDTHAELIEVIAGDSAGKPAKLRGVKEVECVNVAAAEYKRMMKRGGK
jgi:hypothetical protein